MDQHVKELIERFQKHAPTYRSAKYNETELREDFLNPFFKSLGWDITNEQGHSQAVREVFKEEALRLGDSVKAPDFTFRTGGQRKFFVEAKRPSVAIKTAIQPAFQLRRYAWSAKLPLSILTDFEEFAVYDCRVRPEKDDAAAKARIFYCTFDEYEKNWDWIRSTFSRDAVLDGSLDKYVESNRALRGSSEVDDDFLSLIEGWRTDLAKDIARKNSSLSERDVNTSVQRIIDRIIFLRICEDRGAEAYGSLQGLIGRSDVYQILCTKFHEADAKYNSGLFHFKKEAGRDEVPDSLTPALNIDSKLLSSMLNALYYPESPYAFSVLPADILGQVYEQFLGKVIRLTEGHRAVVELKPEVRRAGGVYYTPSYIVDYMVAHTIGSLVAGKSEKQIADIKVVDPACGSGSFLIAVYQFFLDWYLRYYVENDPKKWARARRAPIVEVANNEWRLTLDERKRILLAHVYGVDIDTQAVEVTKLSLLLKVLEGETDQTLQPYLALLRERALPDLGKNIKCGNTLIGSDFYAHKAHLFDDFKPEKINVFDWGGKDGFPDIMARKGFDVVIGNPPYIFVREQITDAESEYFSSVYKLGWEKQNTFMLFMEAMLRLTRPSGLGAFIVPNSWLTIESAKLLRMPYIDRLTRLVDMNYPAFKKVSMEPCIYVISGENVAAPVKGFVAHDKAEFEAQELYDVDRTRWHENGDRISLTRAGDDLAEILDVVKRRVSSIEKSYDVRTGLQAYEKGKGTPPQTAEDVRNHIFDARKKLDDTTYRYLEGRDVSRYQLDWSGMWMRYGRWLSQPREIGNFTRPRVLLREITAPFPKCLFACFTQEQFLHNKSILGVHHVDDDVYMLKALACVLNSTLMSAFYKEYAVKSSRKIFPKVVIKNLREFPFPRNPEKSAIIELAATHDEISNFVSRHSSAIENDAVLERQLRGLQAGADDLVFRLYGVSPAEGTRISLGPTK